MRGRRGGWSVKHLCTLLKCQGLPMLLVLLKIRAKWRGVYSQDKVSPRVKLVPCTHNEAQSDIILGLAPSG